jgi:hypothetical protein
MRVLTMGYRLLGDGLGYQLSALRAEAGGLRTDS